MPGFFLVRSGLTLLLVLQLNACALCSNDSSSANKCYVGKAELKGDVALSDIKIKDGYEFLDHKNIPPVVVMTDMQKDYLKTVIQAAFSVVLGDSTLEKEESIFGSGLFFYPKSPNKPTKVLRYYSSDNFKIDTINLSFERKTQISPWVSCVLAIDPRNFPRGNYFMDFPPELFGDFILDKVYFEDRPTQSLKRVNVFVFHHKNKGNVKLMVEAAESVSSIEDKFPKGFHFIKLVSTGE